MTITREHFEETVASILRDHGSDMTADLSDQLVAYWNGRGIAYVSMQSTSSTPIYEEFIMDDDQWRSWRSWLEVWLERPTFSIRPEARGWLSEAPPFEPET